MLANSLVAKLELLPPNAVLFTTLNPTPPAVLVLKLRDKLETVPVIEETSNVKYALRRLWVKLPLPLLAIYSTDDIILVGLVTAVKPLEERTVEKVALEMDLIYPHLVAFTVAI